MKRSRKTLELLNIVSDLHRAIMFYVTTSHPSYQKSIFLKNIVTNFPKLKKLDPKITQFIDINSLKSDRHPPRVKAEHMLLSANLLQNYLLYE